MALMPVVELEGDGGGGGEEGGEGKVEGGGGEVGGGGGGETGNLSVKKAHRRSLWGLGMLVGKGGRVEC